MKKAIVFLAEGFEEIEALTPVDYFRRVGIEVDTVSITEDKKVESSRKITVLADKLLKEVNPSSYDLAYIPGGIPGALNLRDSKEVIELIQKMNEEEKIIAAICVGPVVLEKAGLLEGKRATSFPTMKDELKSLSSYVDDEIVVVDKNIVTGRGAGISIYETMKLIEILLGREAVEKLKGGIQQDKVEKFFGFKA